MSQKFVVKNVDLKRKFIVQNVKIKLKFVVFFAPQWYPILPSSGNTGNDEFSSISH